MAKTIDVFKRFGERGLASATPSEGRSAPGWMSSFALRLLLSAAVVAVLPFLINNHFYLYTLTGGAVLLMAVLGLNLAISGGIISIGTAAFLLIGSYTVGLAQTRWHMNPLPATLLAAAVCAAVGFITAFPALKMGPFAVAVVTLMYASVASDLILRFTSFTGGSEGVAARAISFTPNEIWFLTAGVAGALFVGHRNLIHSPMGRALMMGRRSEPVASSLRISTARFKLAAFTIYAGLAGVAGSFYQMLNGPISSETFTVGVSITVLLMVVLGGEASVAGPLLGAVVLTVIPLILNQTVSHGGAVRDVIYGGILLAVVLVVPGGLAELGTRLVEPLRRARRSSPVADADAAPAARGRSTATGAPVDAAALSAVVFRVEEPAELDIRAISRAIGGLRILDDVSLTVEAASIHGLIGPNGSGKTTLLNCVSGLSKVNGGQIVLAGDVLPGVASRHAKAGVGRTFQTVLLSESDSVRDNLLVGVDAHRRASYVSYTLRLPPAITEARGSLREVTRWAEALGLRNLLDNPVSSLTPRERRLVEIGRALSAHPRVLLLDEPAAGLTGGEIEELERIIRAVRDAGVTVLLVEHHAELVMRLCDRVTVLDVGRVLVTDVPAKVSTDPQVVAAYLGDELTESAVER
jgi:branched-chain amino acid transport system permease protein